MGVQRLAMPSGPESGTVDGDDLPVVAAAELYVAHLAAIERSPDTIRAYVQSLGLWGEFLGFGDVAWQSAEIEDVSEFVRWSRAPTGNVIVLNATAARRAEATVNWHLHAVFGFYDFHARSGVALAASLVAWRRVPRGSYKPFLHDIRMARPIAAHSFQATSG